MPHHGRPLTGRRPTPRLVAVALVCLAFAAPVAAEPVAIPGTRVSLEPPPGFSVSEKFSGVENPELMSSIVVNELPVSAAKMLAGLTAEGLLSRGMTLVKSEDAKIDGRKGRLLAVTQTAEDVVFEKWMAAMGTDSATVLVVATYPRAYAGDLSAPLRAAALSATWRPDAKVDLFDGLSFRVGESEHLKIRNRMQSLLLLAHPDRPVGPSSDLPLAVVGSSISPTKVDDIAAFAKQRVAQSRQLGDLHDIEGDERQVGGRDAYELTARATDLQTGGKVAVYQLVVVDGTTYYLMQGFVAEARFAEFLPEFRQVAGSLEVR